MLPVRQDLDFLSASRMRNLLAAVNSDEPVTLAQLNALAEGIAWKDNVRLASTGNVNTAAPGANMDGPALAANDRVLLKDQTDPKENGIYIWTGAATALTRAADANAFDELESAVVTVDEGTANTGTTWRQTQVNGVIGTNNIVWTLFGATVPDATETTAGKAEIATQTETDTGTDDARIVSPLKFKTSTLRAKGYAATFGDGSATSYAITHNLNTRDVVVRVYETAGNFREVLCETQLTSVNQVTLVFSAAVASNALRCVIVSAPAA